MNSDHSWDRHVFLTRRSYIDMMMQTAAPFVAVFATALLGACTASSPPTTFDLLGAAASHGHWLLSQPASNRAVCVQA